MMHITIIIRFGNLPLTSFSGKTSFRRRSGFPKRELNLTSSVNPVFIPVFGTRRRGVMLKPGAMPDEAVSDIFTNGREYAFECSTAMVVVFYYAVLLSIGPRHFNRLFQNLLVWNWNYDENLKIITKSGRDYIPGDVVYFHNPDFQNPVWIGENAVYMGNDMYYGHDIGIVAKKEMIEALNQLRKPGAKRSAYMLPQHSRLDFRFYMGFAGHFSPAAPGVRSM